MIWHLVILADGTRFGFRSPDVAAIVAKMYPGSRVEKWEPVLREVQGELFYAA